MSVKILANTIIPLEQLRDPSLEVFTEDSQGIVAVFNNNSPVMYLLTPERLRSLLHAEETLSAKAQIELEQQFFADDSSLNNPAPTGKFCLYHGWQPDSDFIRQAAIWGIKLLEPVNQKELAAFIDYWRAENRAYHHIQWQQKLARNLQLNRANRMSDGRSDFTQIDEPDSTIPKGFRGEL
jgi:DNA replication protein DnaT